MVQKVITVFIQKLSKWIQLWNYLPCYTRSQLAYQFFFFSFFFFLGKLLELLI